MEHTSITGLVILIATFFVSYKGIKDYGYLSRYSFQVDAILVHKDYKRLITSGFLHSGWMHFIFNMAAFYSFSQSLEMALGIPLFLGLYFGSLLGGNLLSLFIHRNHAGYSAVGASGAICGLIFASIALFPDIEIGLIFVPYGIPGWAFGLLYVLYTIYGIRAQHDNIGHDAHLGGGLTGLVIAFAVFPESIRTNFVPVALMLIPSLVFLYLIFTRPAFLLVDKPFQKNRGLYTSEDQYNTQKLNDEKELNSLLDKIGRTGMDSLTAKEKERLEKFSGIR